MTVAELIEHLKALPPEMKVVTEGPRGSTFSDIQTPIIRRVEANNKQTAFAVYRAAPDDDAAAIVVAVI